jgi:hypothetical protein
MAVHKIRFDVQITMHPFNPLGNPRIQVAGWRLNVHEVESDLRKSNANKKQNDVPSLFSSNQPRNEGTREMN